MLQCKVSRNLKENIQLQKNLILVFHEFHDLRTPIYSGICACSYVSALLRSVVIFGTALRRFLYNDDDVDSRAKAKNETGTGCFLSHIFEQTLVCCTHIDISVSTYTRAQETSFVDSPICPGFCMTSYKL